MAEEKRAIIHIDKDTLIPIGLAIAVGTSLIAGSWFMSDLNAKVNQQETRISNLETTVIDIATIKQDVSAMKTNIDWIKSTLSEIK